MVKCEVATDVWSDYLFQSRRGPDRDSLRSDPGQSEEREEQLHQPHQHSTDPQVHHILSLSLSLAEASDAIKTSRPSESSNWLSSPPSVVTFYKLECFRSRRSSLVSGLHAQFSHLSRIDPTGKIPIQHPSPLISHISDCWLGDIMTDDNKAGQKLFPVNILQSETDRQSFIQTRSQPCHWVF